MIPLHPAELGAVRCLTDTNYLISHFHLDSRSDTTKMPWTMATHSFVFLINKPQEQKSQKNLYEASKCVSQVKTLHLLIFYCQCVLGLRRFIRSRTLSLNVSTRRECIGAGSTSIIPRVYTETRFIGLPAKVCRKPRKTK